MGKKKTYSIEYAMEKAQELDITLLATEYHGWSAPMDFICNKHPELGINQTSMRSLEFGQCSCKACKSMRIGKGQIHITIDDLRQEFKERNLTLLSNEYINCKTPLDYICDIHPEEGIQHITYDSFKNQAKYCCRACARQATSEWHQTPIEDIIQAVEAMNFTFIGIERGNNRKTIVLCMCNNHPDKGIQRKALMDFISPSRHYGCKYCYGNVMLTQEEYEERYELDKKHIKMLSKYNGNKEYGDYECLECGYIWTVQAGSIRNCPNCSGSLGEMKIRDFLDMYCINYKREYSFDDLYGDYGKQLRFDFAVFDNDKLVHLIEFDGIQHEKPVDFKGKGEWYANERFKSLKIYDERKNKYCATRKIPLTRIAYKDIDNIENILTEILNLQEEKVG